jgi:hypothetical protein
MGLSLLFCLGVCVVVVTGAGTGVGSGKYWYPNKHTDANISSKG